MSRVREHLKLWSLLVTDKQIGHIVEGLRQYVITIPPFDIRKREYYERLIKTIERQAKQRAAPRENKVNDTGT